MTSQAKYQSTSCAQSCFIYVFNESPIRVRTRFQCVCVCIYMYMCMCACVCRRGRGCECVGVCSRAQVRACARVHCVKHSSDFQSAKELVVGSPDLLLALVRHQKTTDLHTCVCVFVCTRVCLCVHVCVCVCARARNDRIGCEQ